jgi:hypothetical protein
MIYPEFLLASFYFLLLLLINFIFLQLFLNLYRQMKEYNKIRRILKLFPYQSPSNLNVRENNLFQFYFHLLLFFQWIKVPKNKDPMFLFCSSFQLTDVIVLTFFFKELERINSFQTSNRSYFILSKQQFIGKS